MATKKLEQLNNISASTSSLSALNSDDEMKKCGDSELLQKILPEEVS